MALRCPTRHQTLSTKIFEFTMPHQRDRTSCTSSPSQFTEGHALTCALDACHNGVGTNAHHYQGRLGVRSGATSCPANFLDWPRTHAIASERDWRSYWGFAGMASDSSRTNARRKPNESHVGDGPRPCRTKRAFQYDPIKPVAVESRAIDGAG